MAGKFFAVFVHSSPWSHCAGLFHPEFLSNVHRRRRPMQKSFTGTRFPLPPSSKLRGIYYGVLALEQTQLSMRSPFLDNDFVRTVFRSPASALASNEVSLRLIADGNRDLLRVPTDRGLAGNRGRVFGAASRGFLEFLFKAEYAYDMGMPQWLARLDHAFSPLPPRAPLPGKTQALPFPRLVPGCLGRIRSGNAA